MKKSVLSRTIIRKIKEYVGTILWNNFTYIKRENSLTVLMLHRVFTDNKLVIGDKNLCISAGKLEKVINVLSSKFTFCDLYNRPSILNNCSLSITFDDGWQDNYPFAMQYLVKKHIPFTIFLTAGLINTNKNLWFHSLDILADFVETVKIIDFFKETIPCSEKTENLTDMINQLKKYPIGKIESFIDKAENRFNINLMESQQRTLLNWDEITELTNAEASFGSHGMKHAIMPVLNDTEMIFEAAQSWNVLQNRIKTFIPIYSFPNGSYSKECIDICKKYGYKSGLSANLQMQQFDDNFKIIPRISISEQMSISLIKYRICSAHLKKKQVR